MNYKRALNSLLPHAALFLGLSVLVAFLGVPLFLVLMVLLTGGAFYISSRSKRLAVQRRTVVAIVVIVSSLRLAGEAALFLEVNSVPFRPDSKGDFVLRKLPFSLYVIGHLHHLDREAERRFLAIRHAAPDTVLCTPRPGAWDPFGIRQCITVASIDPFTGEPYLAKGVALYSLGPDGVDHHGALTYDPQNGTFRPGDILLDRLHPPPLPGTQSRVGAASRLPCGEGAPWQRCGAVTTLSKAQEIPDSKGRCGKGKA